MISNNKVCIVVSDNKISYPVYAPFLPSEVYPEIANNVRNTCDEFNYIYPLMRKLFLELSLDVDNFGHEYWNPLGRYISQGQQVLVKPNLVRHVHMKNGDYRTVVTHGAVIRCVLDYVCLALQGKGKVIVGDAPVQSANFEIIVEKNYLFEICKDVEKSWRIPVQLVDFRLNTVLIDKKHNLTRRIKKEYKENDYKAVNLGQHSMLTSLSGYNDLFRVTNYDCSEMVTHHNSEKHEYLVPQHVLDADVVISIPKLKTHRKVGLTAALKNLVGINGHKDWLPHHRKGAYCEGGDEYKYPSLIKKIITNITEKEEYYSGYFTTTLINFILKVLRKLSLYISKDMYEEGSWYGNDTIWRTVLDLNRLLIYADKDGVMQESPQRKYFTIVDAIIAGDGEGPMEPDPQFCSMLAGGECVAAVDEVLASLVGFDTDKIPLIKNAFLIDKWPLADFTMREIDLIIKRVGLNGKVYDGTDIFFHFTPPAGWKGHIEK